MKIGRCEVAERSRGLPNKKNSGSAGLVHCQPHFAQNRPIGPKIPRTLSPLDSSTYTEFCPDRMRFSGLIPERLIFWPKKSIQYRLSVYKNLYQTGSLGRYVTCCLPKIIKISPLLSKLQQLAKVAAFFETQCRSESGSKSTHSLIDCSFSQGLRIRKIVCENLCMTVIT